MNVIVIGGGASGLMAALTAARNGHAVTLLERQSRVGRKLLSTGNGRCNLTNLHVAPVHYHGLSPDFVRPALDAFDTGAALAFFHGLGLLTVGRGQRPGLPLFRSGRQRAGRSALCCRCCRGHYPHGL